jgi:hypothetical protein
VAVTPDETADLLRVIVSDPWRRPDREGLSATGAADIAPAVSCAGFLDIEARLVSIVEGVPDLLFRV